MKTNVSTGFFHNVLYLFIFIQAKTRLEVCSEVLQHPEGPVPIMDQSKCSDVRDAARCDPGR